MYYYSPSTNTFIYDSLIEKYAEAGTLPDDLKEVSDDVYQEFAAENPPEGKVRGTLGGMPIWIEAVPPTEAELAAIALYEKARKLEDIATKTELWRTQLALGMLDEADREHLINWMAYAQAVQQAEDSAEWPEEPADVA